MTREEHLAFCKKCTNRKMDSSKGLVCKLTDEQANFENECPDFSLDENYVERAREEDAEIMTNADIVRQVPKELIEKLKLEQKLIPAIIAGSVVGLLGAVLWAAISYATQYQIGIMALAIGAAVGFTIRYVGKGIDIIYGVIGAVISLISVALGNLFAIIAFGSDELGISISEIISLLNFQVIVDVYAETFSFMDIVFYGIAIYEGYRFAFRQITPEEILKFNKQV